MNARTPILARAVALDLRRDVGAAAAELAAAALAWPPDDTAFYDAREALAAAGLRAEAADRAFAALCVCSGGMTAEALAEAEALVEPH